MKTNLLNTKTNQCHRMARSLAAMLVFLCFACHEGGEVESVNDSRVVTFSATPSFTRASGTYLQELYQSFLVSTFKTMEDNSVQMVMDKYEVRFDDSKRWYYDNFNGQYLKYWDLNAASYKFAAVTPVPGTSGVGNSNATVDISNDGEISIKGIIGNSSTGDYDNSSHSADWMIARTVRTMATPEDKDDMDNNYQLPRLNSQFSEVPLNFHHIMAKVDFKVYSKKGVIQLTKFNVLIPDAKEDGITNQGDYSTDGGWTNTKAVSDGQQDPKRFGIYMYLETKSVTEGKDNAVMLASHVQIPQLFPTGGREFSIECVTRDGKRYTGTIKLDASNGHAIDPTDPSSPIGWQQDKHYTYILMIDDAEGLNEVILFAVDVNKWQWEEGNSQENEQHNW